jgi:hypothetical protein
MAPKALCKQLLPDFFVGGSGAGPDEEEEGLSGEALDGVGFDVACSFDKEESKLGSAEGEEGAVGTEVQDFIALGRSPGCLVEAGSKLLDFGVEGL